MARLPEVRPLLCYITDSRALPARRSPAQRDEGGPPENLLPVIGQAIAAGVDLLQIRERLLETRDLLTVVKAALAQARGTATQILVNDRLDVALAAGAHGLHLPTHGFSAAEVRRRFPDLLLGASCHNLEELSRAEQGGADFTVFGPVFETASKKVYGLPLGTEKLAEAVRVVAIPVLALGGITLSNAADCLRAGAAGLAAISLFQTSLDLKETVRQLRALAPAPQNR